MRKSVLAAAAAGTALAVGMAAPAFADDHDTIDLSVFHGVPGATVDVYVNDDLTVPGFEPGDLAGPLTLPAGDYDVEIFMAGDDPATDTPVLPSITLPLEAGMNYTAVAHLDTDSNVTASLFTNDMSHTAAGEGRVTVRHTANAPGVDVWANGSVLFSNLENPDEVGGDVPSDTYEIAVSVHDDTDPVLGPLDLELPAGVNTIVYAYGTAGDDLTVGVQSIEVGAASPDGIPSGTQGLAADSSTTGLIVAMLLALAAVGVTARVVTARR